MSNYNYMFLRLRLWGKSAFLDTLIHYYDKLNKDQFEEIFGDLYIGKHPTSARNSLLVIQFNFQKIAGITDMMEETFNNTINYDLERFLERYQAILGGNHSNLLDRSNASSSLDRVLELIASKQERLFVGVDNYDSPVRSVTIFEESNMQYRNAANFLKTRFFSYMKRATHVVSKYWITGILPVFREEPSPLNATQIISNMPAFNGACGLNDTEVRQIAESYLSPSKELGSRRRNEGD
ncbi:DUF1703-domain-containing protein [Serendipita vermifera]|nr:DUF1703-domain-containing protein [Serendipita vermifera]